MKESKKKCLSQKLRDKIKNRRNDLHFKVINFIVKNFNSVLFGDLSVKGVVETKLGKKSKRVLHSLNLFRFKERLKEKCLLYDVEFKEINEYMTSKMCSLCGHIKKDLGLNKVFDCNKCNQKINRELAAVLRKSAYAFSSIMGGKDYVEEEAFNGFKDELTDYSKYRGVFM